MNSMHCDHFEETRQAAWIPRAAGVSADFQQQPPDVWKEQKEAHYHEIEGLFWLGEDHAANIM